MARKIFLDTDIVIDFFTDRKPFFNSASKIFDLGEKQKVELYLSALSINNIYYVVRKFLGHKKSIEVIEELLEMVNLLATSKAEIVQALKNDFKDFEDSIQYSTAMVVEGMEAIITRNVKDYANSEIPVFTSYDFLKIIAKE